VATGINNAETENVIRKFLELAATMKIVLQTVSPVVNTHWQI
jgi:hypothetical protein